MTLNKKQAQLDALWGKDGYLAYQFDEGGRQSNRDYRRKEVSNRLKGIMGLMARQAAPPDISRNPQATNSPTDMPALGGHQDRSLGGFQAGTIGNYQAGSYEPLLDILTGEGTQQDIYAKGAAAYPGLMSGGADKPAHAYGSQRMTERFGAPIATAVGMGKEAFTGGMNVLGGGEFFGPSGFDPADLDANFQGIEGAQGPLDRGIEAAKKWWGGLK